MKCTFFLYGLVLIMCVACQEDEPPTVNCYFFQDLVKKDQFYRTHPELAWSSLLALQLDSTTTEGFLSDIDFSSYSKAEELEYRKQAFFPKTQQREPDQALIDSMWNLQSAIDYQNTEQLLDIIEYTDPEILRSDSLNYCFSEALVVFVHSPDELFDRVKQTLQNHDLNFKVFAPARYEHIMWHLGGR